MTITSACHRTDRQPRQKSYCRILAGTCIILLAVCLLIWPVSTLASNTLTLINEEPGNISLSGYIESYEAGINSVEFASITQLENSQWRKTERQKPAEVFRSRHTVWHRIKIANSNAATQILVINNSNPLSDSTIIFSCDETQKNCIKLTQENETKIPTTINIESGKIKIIYIKISGFWPTPSSLNMMSVEDYKKYSYKKTFYEALIDGIIAGLTIYIFLLAIKTRQAMYYSYCLLGLCNILTIIFYQKIIPQKILDISPEVITSILLVLPAFTISAIIQFVLVFTEASTYNKKINNYLLIYIATILLIALSFILGAPIEIILPAFVIISGMATCTMCYLFYIDKNHPRPVIAILTFGICMPAMAGFFTILPALTDVSSAINYMQITQIFDTLEMMVFAIAMLSSVKFLQDDHERQVAAALQAATISKAHNRLLAHLNHELRTPLNGILGAAEILVHKSPPRDRHIFSMICHTALPLKHLIDQMVDVSAVTEDKKNLQLVRFDLQSLLQECMDVFLPVAQEKNIRLFFTIEYDIANDVTGDQNRLRQILINLIGNACKFTSDGEIGLSVRMEPSLRDGSFLYYFEVKDSGTGVSPETEKKLFGAFETINSTTNPKGTGLGLSIVHDLSKMLGGSCGYRNNDTIGSTFWFSAALEPHQNIHRKAHGAFENISIVIADENDSIGKNLIRHVSGVTHITTAVNSLEKLNHEIDSGKYDIAIVHRSLINKSLIDKVQDRNMFFICYIDQVEMGQGDKKSEILCDDYIIRKISIEAFSLQLADCIIKKSNLIKNKSKSTENKSIKKILAAEDIPANQYIISELIESLGFMAIICSNGRQAFDLYLQHILENDPFDAIIMDCEMPIQDGFETSRKIRSYEKEHGIKNTPIIALTAHTESAYRQRSEQAGMDAYLTKPVTAERILQCLIDQENI